MSTFLINGFQVLAVATPRGGERDERIVILVLQENVSSKRCVKWL
jgi:hypothetical protein